MRKRKIWIWSAVFLLMWSLFLIYGGRFLVYRHITPVEGPAIIVPLMGGMPDRSLEAARQFSETEDAEMLFVAPIDPEKYFMDSLEIPLSSTAENFRKVMVRLGVPPQKLRYLRGPATSTMDEADLVARYLGRNSTVKRVVVVSSAFHSRRAYQIFRDRFQKAGVSATINIAPSRYTDFNPEAWYRRKQDAVFVVTEWLKILYYHLIGQFQ
jgi:uncharacterized SAM-binding protein YcdF (DUF218 family)